MDVRQDIHRTCPYAVLDNLKSVGSGQLDRYIRIGSECHRASLSVDMVNGSHHSWLLGSSCRISRYSH